jgi:hypothetical protein
MRTIRSKMIEVSSYEAPLIVGALREKLAKVSYDLQLLQIARHRDLTPKERAELPSTMQEYSLDELREQIDPWISLRDTYRGLIEDFDPDKF